MSSATLKNVIEVIYQRGGDIDIDDMVFATLRTLYDLSKSQQLSPETSIFLNCQNNTVHMRQLLVSIFYNENDIEFSILQELRAIMDETPKFEFVEELKNEIVASAQASMGVIETVVEDVRLKFAEAMAVEREALQMSIERVAIQETEPIDEIVGSAIGALVPAIVSDQLQPVLQQNHRLAELIGEGREDENRRLRKQLAALAENVELIKMKLGIVPVHVEKKRRSKRSSTGDDNEDSFF
jgi:hypothetical protein